MFLAELNSEDFENILSYKSLSNNEVEGLETIFYAFKCKLIQNVVLFNNASNIDFTSITSSDLRNFVHQFNTFYHNSTDQELCKVKKSFIIDDYDVLPDIELVIPFIESLETNNEKLSNLYIYGLILIWEQQNLWSFMAVSDEKYQQFWFASFYLLSDQYFQLWQLHIIDDAIKSSISNKNSKAAKKKHENSDMTKKHAIQMFLERKNQSKSIKQIALYISIDVIGYGKKNGFIFSSAHQAVDTIYKWLLEYNKNQT